MSNQDNPLLLQSGLPRFDLIKPEHIEPAISFLIEQTTQKLEHLEQGATPTWEGLVEPLELLGLPFEYAWSPINHLMGVKNAEALREAHQAVLPSVVSLGLRMSQSKPLYDALIQIRDGEAWNLLDEAQQRVITLKIRAAEHAGVGLEGAEKERFAEISQELSRLATDFSNHVLDSTKAFELIITDVEHTAGWPESLKQIAAQSYAQSREEETKPAPEHGPWRITLDFPSYGPFMMHSRQRDQREMVYKAYVTRASEGEWNNMPLIDRILALRKEKASLLGFDTYAALSLEAKMAPGVTAVEKMNQELKGAAEAIAKTEMDAIAALASNSGAETPLSHWDLAFWQERLREKQFDYTDDQLRPYFPFERVLNGLFALCERLFQVTFKQRSEEPSVWHEDVRFYEVWKGDSSIAYFYLDPYSRPHEKRGGAWMDTCLDRRMVHGETVLPVVHLCCNGTPPVGGRPSLMSFREVETLFHEFGHGLQGMLTTINYTDVAGVNGVEWDAVELASQFMENWCYHKPTLLSMTAHVDTGEPLPDELFEKVSASRTFMSGSKMMRQLLFGAMDIYLHSAYMPGGDETPFEVQKSFTKQYSPLPPYKDNRFLCAFSHIFAGGYAAGYYSYKWAEVLSADAFAAFEEAGLDQEEALQDLGKTYRDTILSLGGSRHPMEVYKAFRGREPSTEALLRHSGLLK